MEKILDTYIRRTEEIISSLMPLSKTDTIFASVRTLIEDMQNEALSCNDEMLHPTLYNAAATIATAPAGCSVRQLSEALTDARDEMELMKEYFKTNY